MIRDEMQHCLSKKELDLLIDNNWNFIAEYEFENLGQLLNSCKNWESELVCFSYFLSQALERKEKAEGDCQVILRRAFELSSEMWLLIQQFDSEFIRYLFRYVRDKNVSLEEGLIGIQINLSQHIYE